MVYLGILKGNYFVILQYQLPVYGSWNFICIVTYIYQTDLRLTT